MGDRCLRHLKSASNFVGGTAITTIVRFSGHPFGLLTSVSATAHKLWRGLIGFEPTRIISTSLLRPLSSGLRYSIECHLITSTSAISSQTPKIGAPSGLRSHRSKWFARLESNQLPIFYEKIARPLSFGQVKLVW